MFILEPGVEGRIGSVDGPDWAFGPPVDGY